MSAVQRFLGRMSCWTPTAALLLGVLLGAAAGAPAPDATPLDRRWETLFSRSVLWVSGEKPGLSWETDYLLGIQRVRRLYCNVGIGFHLQVLPDGGISGAHSEDPYSLIQISTVERGVVSLFGLRSERFVAMNSRGRLYGTTVFHDECKFRESLLANNYNAYESAAHRGCFIALSKHGRIKRGNRATTAMTVTHFLPRM
ncbi:fibroblast growth factor 6-like [Gambusia affinis]|uniref:fibroblast growth factor 6-like n=1 Tax=Gambusia affinis TaxID=33528 RepID=UPI001CDC774E|nr:fibroblast growth factor 6-like [Gambusia affinis]